tara:strand:+ start:918 stop:2930 length:2013 start_codon:yes stop_codon:yes gene_type:complete
MTMTLTQVTTGGVDENINIDSNTLKVDGTNNRVGIGTAAPAQPLDIVTSGADAYIRQSNGTVTGFVGVNNNNSTFDIYTFSNHPTRFFTNNAERMRIGNDGKIYFGDFSSAAAAGYIDKATSGSYELDIVASRSTTTNRDIRFFSRSNQESMRIDTNGNIGVGMTSPTEKLSVFSNNDSSAVDNGLAVYRSAGDDKVNINCQGGAARFISDGGSSYIPTRFGRYNGTTLVEDVTIDNAGRLLVGTTSEFSGGLSTTLIQGVASGGGYVGLARNDSSVADGNGIGGLRFYANDPSGYNDVGIVQCVADGAHAADDYPTRLEFHTTADNASSPTERLRIKSDGTLHAIKSGTQITNAEQTVAVFQRSSASGSTSKISIISGNAASSHVNFGDTDDEDTGMIAYVHSTNAMQFHTNGGTERMRLDSAGNLGVGSSSPGAKLDVTGNVLLSAANPKITFNTGGANIHAPAANTLAFNTDSSNTRLRINSNGHILFAPSTTHVPGLTNTVVGGAYEHLGTNGGALFISRADGPAYFANRNSDGTLFEFRRSGSLVGTITVNSSSTTYNTSSDYRLKENVVDIANAIIRVKQLAPKRFNFIADANTTVDGFLAHEAQAVVPEAVTGTHNEVDEDGNAVMQGIDQSKLVPLLTAALQEAIVKIETLETKVAALEAAA